MSKENNTKLCRYCKSEIDTKARLCPNCRKKQSNPFIRVLCTFLGVIIIIAGLAVLVDNTEETAKENFSYEVTKEYQDDYGFSYYIEGVVTNKTSKDYSYAQIEFICYDSDGNNLGTALDNTNNLLGKETWKFKAMGLFTDQIVDHCEYKEVTGW